MVGKRDTPRFRSINTEDECKYANEIMDSEGVTKVQGVKIRIFKLETNRRMSEVCKEEHKIERTLEEREACFMDE